MESIISSLIEYGVLGIIAYFYLKQSIRRDTSNMENFQAMLNTVMNKDNTEQMATIINTLNAHNQNSTKLIMELVSKIDDALEEKAILTDMLHEYSDMGNEFKEIVETIRTDASKSQTDLINIMIREGYVTKEQVIACNMMKKRKDDIPTDLSGLVDDKTL